MKRTSYREWIYTLIKMKQKQEFKEGDILECEWGYDQTNVDFYKVVQVKGMWAYVRKIKSCVVEDETLMMQGTSEPLDEFKSDKIKRRKIHHSSRDGKPYIMISSFESADLWNGKPSRCSWYA